MNTAQKKPDSPPSPKRGGVDYGRRLKTAREALGYETATDFAKALGINPQTYRNYERGQREMSYEDLAKVAARGVSIEYLILGIAPAVVPALQKNA